MLVHLILEAGIRSHGGSRGGGGKGVSGGELVKAFASA